MANTKRVKKKDTKKTHKKRRRHDSDVTSGDESEGDRTPRKKHRRDKKKKFRKPKRRRSTSSEKSSNYGDMTEILKTPPKHQRMKRVMYRRKIRNIDPDMFISLKKFAYDKEKMIQQAFLTLRRGLIERICPPELSHLTMDELKDKLVKLACTMSKERLRTYADDDDMSHSSDSYEVDTPTDLSDSELEMIDDDDLVDSLFEEKNKAIMQENEMREKLARKMAEKALLARMKVKAPEVNVQTEESKQDEKVETMQEKAEVEEGEILSDNEVSKIPLPSSPQPVNISDDEESPPPPFPSMVLTEFLQPPPPPPFPTPPVQPTIILHYDLQPIATTSPANESIVRLVPSKQSAPIETLTPDGSISENLEKELSALGKHLLPNIDSGDEVDYDEDGFGSEPEGPDIDL